MRKAYRFIIMSAAILAVLSSAVTAKPKKLFDCTKSVAKAIHQYQKKDYGGVISTLDEVKFQCGGNSVIDTVLYYMGLAYLGDKKAAEAKSEFQQIVQSYPNSPFAEEAHFRLGQCSFLQSNPYDRDQTETNDAIREFTDFIDLYAGNPFADSAKSYRDKCFDKLAKKEFEIGRFYQTQEEFEAAIVYYKNVITEYPGCQYAPQARLNTAFSLAKINRTTEAKALIADIRSGACSSETEKKLGEIEKIIEKSEGKKN